MKSMKNIMTVNINWVVIQYCAQYWSHEFLWQCCEPVSVYWSQVHCSVKMHHVLCHVVISLFTQTHALLCFVVELNNEHTQKVAELEQARQQKLRERQKVYEEAFNQDMEQYLSTGYLQHRGEALSYWIEFVFISVASDNIIYLKALCIVRSKLHFITETNSRVHGKSKSPLNRQKPPRELNLPYTSEKQKMETL